MLLRLLQWQESRKGALHERALGQPCGIAVTQRQGNLPSQASTSLSGRAKRVAVLLVVSLDLSSSSSPLHVLDLGLGTFYVPKAICIFLTSFVGHTK